jgi:hypothetical protein
MAVLDATEPVEQIRAEVLALFHTEDEPVPRGRLGWVDWILLSGLSRLRARGKFSGQRGATALLTPEQKLKAERVLVIGLGPCADLSMTALYRLSYQTAQAILALGCTSIALELPYRAFPGESPQRIRQAFLEGFTAELKRGRPADEFTVLVLPPAD